MFTLQDGRSIRLKCVVGIGPITPVFVTDKANKPKQLGAGFRIAIPGTGDFFWVEHKTREQAESERRAIIDAIDIQDQK